MDCDCDEVIFASFHGTDGALDDRQSEREAVEVAGSFYMYIIAAVVVHRYGAVPVCTWG